MTVEAEWFAYFLMLMIGLIDLGILLLIRWWLRRLEIKRFAREEGVPLPWETKMFEQEKK